ARPAGTSTNSGSISPFVDSPQAASKAASSRGAARYTKPCMALLLRGNRAWSLDLCHQPIIPLAIHDDVAGGTHFRFDQVVVEVGINTRLAEGVECHPGRATPHEPGFEVLQRRVVELAGFPYPVPVATNQVRTGVTVGLRMDQQDRLANAGSQGVLAGQGTDPAVEDHVARDQA